MKTVAFTLLALTTCGTLAADKPRVLVARFDALGDDKPWIARSLQTSLLAELTRQGLAPLAWPQALEDAAAAVNLARAQNAAYVIIGSTQALDTEVRVTGQIINVATGQIAGGLVATGAIRDIFAIQDQLAAQVQATLAPPRAAPADPILPQPPAQPAPAQPAANDALAAELARAQALNRELERAIQRLNDAADRALDTPAPSYVRSGVYSPFYGGYYPTYGVSRSYSVGGSGLSISGAYRGDNFVVGFRYGSGFNSSRGASTVGGNYVRTGPMVMQPVRR